MSDILIRKEGRAGRITLNRPKALNALTYDMAMAIEAALIKWRHDGDVHMVLIDGAGEKAFCAGGDIQALYHEGRAGNLAYGRRFWADEYRMNALVANYPKPYVAIMHGVVMGGGVGVSAHGSHRIVTEGTMVAMPECSIGLIPDVGGSFILGHAPGRIGDYLGLTGARIGPADAIFAGFADRYVPAEKIGATVEALVESGDPDAAALHAEIPPAGDLPRLKAEIDTAFAGADPAAIRDALAGQEADWAREAAKGLDRACPLSAACALIAIRAGAEGRVEDALAREYRFTHRCMDEGEFLEGIRAAVIDKDRRPNWALPRHEDVGQARAEAMLAPLGPDDLRL